ncbi:MAG: cache domain-containing protein, partial [Kiritimatiellia bacterium]
MFLINRSIASRLALMVVLGAGGILVAIVGYTYFAVRAMLMSELEIKARYMASATVNRIETVERAIEKTVQGMAVALELSPSPAVGDIYILLRRMLADNPDIYGAAIALRPSLELEGMRFNAPYVCRSGDKLVEKNLGSGNYRYDVWDWFYLPQKLLKPVWSEPYYDEGGGNTLMVTYSVPVFRSNEFWGVVTSDISLEWLSDLMASLSAGKGGYAWLVSANGTFITHPARELIMNESVFSTSESHPDPVIAASGRLMGQRMVRGESDFVPFTSVVSGSKGWLFFAPIRASGWSLAVMFMRGELMRQVFSLNRVIFGLGAAGIALLLLMAFGIARSITNPIRRLALAAQALAGGNLDASLPKVAGRDEVASLAGDFERMRDDLRLYIARLKETTAVRERIESELRIAHAIQMDLVPKTFPPFPSRKDLDIFGILDPAREVGGDFYDFYMPDDRRIFLFIGDVSGKGMPAALFMAVTRTLLKSITREEQNPGLILRRLNSELSADNEANMFVTVFCAI